MSKATVSGRQTTNTFAYMFVGAKAMLEQAERDQNGQLYNLVSCLIYCAFTIEAYLNHLGQLKHDDWDRKERSLSKLKKFKTLCGEADIEPDFSQRPYSTLHELFAFRDRMAHGKTTTESVRKEVDLPGDSFRLTTESEWQEYSTIGNARRAIEDTEQLVKELHKKSGQNGNPMNYLGGGIFGVQRHNAT
ncbi:hypothetical protein [Halomonas sp. YLGW01]|uniref:hypothetical protein n=1 Tax=Halomonas sp. YLGW01 TaxID=2773308 RepID=UPI00177C8692|nr:hypothetical protein [Halomonas sp. YLGW01]